MDQGGEIEMNGRTYIWNVQQDLVVIVTRLGEDFIDEGFLLSKRFPLEGADPENMANLLCGALSRFIEKHFAGD